MTPKSFSGAINHVYANQLATAQVPCPDCGKEADSSLMLTLRNPTTGDMAYRGCWACLERRLASRQGIDYGTRMLLQRAYNALTMPSSYMDDAEVATDIERVLRGN